jgi:ABC-type phosphate/phosphonate transport system substrate-binding protein
MNIVMTMMVVYVLSVFAITPAHAEIRLGINAPHGELVTLKNWQSMSEYLSMNMGSRVRIVPLATHRVLGYAETEITKPLHFILANPVQTLYLQQHAQYTPLLSLHGQHGDHYAGVIVVHKDSDIHKIADLRGKKVIAMPPSSAAAHIFQVYHLHQHGVDAYKDLALFSYTRNQDQALLALHQGKFEAAFVRSGVLEGLNVVGLDKNLLRVLDEQHTPNFNLRHSTALYPEYVLSASATAPDALREKLIQVLRSLTPSHSALHATGVSHFSAVHSLAAVADILAVLEQRQDKTAQSTILAK